MSDKFLSRYTPTASARSRGDPEGRGGYTPRHSYSGNVSPNLRDDPLDYSMEIPVKSKKLEFAEMSLSGLKYYSFIFIASWLTLGAEAWKRTADVARDVMQNWVWITLMVAGYIFLVVWTFRSKQLNVITLAASILLLTFPIMDANYIIKVSAILFATGCLLRTLEIAFDFQLSNAFNRFRKRRGPNAPRH